MQGGGEQTVETQTVALTEAVIDALAFPAAVLDGSGKVLHRNRPFADFIATRSGERLWRRLKIEALGQAGICFVMDAGDGVAGPCILGARTLTGCNQKAYLVTVSAADRPDVGDSGSAILLGDITEAEQAVLFAMLAGRPLAELAQERGTKVSTVRWHLKNLQAKLGATDKADVIAWIARSPVCWLAHDTTDRSDA